MLNSLLGGKHSFRILVLIPAHIIFTRILYSEKQKQFWFSYYGFGTQSHLSVETNVCEPPPQNPCRQTHPLPAPNLSAPHQADHLNCVLKPWRELIGGLSAVANKREERRAHTKGASQNTGLGWSHGVGRYNH